MGFVFGTTISKVERSRETVYPLYHLWGLSHSFMGFDFGTTLSKVEP